MKKTIVLLSAIALVTTAIYSCKKNTTDSLPTTAVLDLPATPYTYQVGFGPSDPTLNYKATLGRVLFYDAHLSVNNAISCASCHKQSLGFADDKAFSIGYEGRLTKRNSPGLNSLAFSGSLFWDGRENNIMKLSLRPLSNHVEMGIEDIDALVSKVAALPYYNQLFAAAFDDATVTSDRISMAIGYFLSAINSSNTRFDDYTAGNSSAMTAQEVEGMNLFDTKYPCGSCHNGGGGGYTSNGTFRDIGMDKVYTDLGRGTISGDPSDKGTFKVPNLRNVALTAPYMHDGRFKTLDEVIDHYSNGICNSQNLDTLLKDSNGNARHMNISDHDKQAMIAFLNTLTDYRMITDPKFSNPFKVK